MGSGPGRRDAAGGRGDKGAAVRVAECAPPGVITPRELTAEGQGAR